MQAGTSVRWNMPPPPMKRMSVDRAVANTLPTSASWGGSSKLFIDESGFYGKWSILAPANKPPPSRTYHFTVKSEEKNFAYIGGGISSKDIELDDLWRFNYDDFTWTQINVKLPKRSQASATLHQTNLYIFGGLSDGEIMNSLFKVDLSLLSVEQIPIDNLETVISPIFQFYNDQLIIWGGFNGSNPSTSLFVIDLKTNNSQKICPKIAGRYGVPWIVEHNLLYSYGGSKDADMLIINLDNFQVEVCPCTGIPPISHSVYGQMCLIESDYAIYYGGQGQNAFTFLYLCDLRSMMWSILEISPDGETTTEEMGKISDIGMFMIPRIYSFSFVFSKKNRSLIAVLGDPEEPVGRMFSISCGDAFSVLHLRNDMMGMIEKGTQTSTGRRLGIPKAASVL